MGSRYAPVPFQFNPLFVKLFSVIKSLFCKFMNEAFDFCVDSVRVQGCLCFSEH